MKIFRITKSDRNALCTSYVYIKGGWTTIKTIKLTCMKCIRKILYLIIEQLNTRGTIGTL